MLLAGHLGILPLEVRSQKASLVENGSSLCRATFLNDVPLCLFHVTTAYLPICPALCAQKIKPAQMFLYYDCAKARRELGFDPKPARQVNLHNLVSPRWLGCELDIIVSYATRAVSSVLSCLHHVRVVSLPAAIVLSALGISPAVFAHRRPLPRASSLCVPPACLTRIGAVRRVAAAKATAGACVCWSRPLRPRPPRRSCTGCACDRDLREGVYGRENTHE